MNKIHGLSGYLLLQFWSYSFNILYDVYTHNGGVHVHMILMVRRGHHLCLADTSFLRIFDENQNPVDMHTPIMCINILQNIKAVALKL
jgi:hypothetical protein